MKPDELLMEELQAGNVKAFDLIIYRYEKSIVNYIYRLMGNFHQAEEISQEAFYRVYKYSLKFDTKRRFSTWLYKIVNNLCIDEMRKKKSETIDMEELNLPSADRTEEIVVTMELQENVKEAILSLPDGQRSVLILKHYQGLSYQEIGEILGCPTGTVKSRMHYALTELKKILAEKRG